MAYKLYAFGSNTHNQLGLPLKIDHTTLQDKIINPTATFHQPKLEALRSIHGGAKHTLLLTMRGAVYGAGNNLDFQLAQNKPTIINDDKHNSNAQHQVISGSNFGLDQQLAGFSELYTGISFCATALTSSAYIVNNKTESGDWECHISTIGTCTWGELGSGKAIDHFSTLVPNVLSGKAISFAAGTYHYVVVLEDGRVYGWGKTRGGQLGSAQQTPSLIPTKLDIPPDLKVAHVVCGNDFTFLYSSTQEGRYLLLGKDKHGIAAGLPSSIAQWKTVCATWHAIFILLHDGRLIAAGKQNQWKLVPDNLPYLVEIATGNEHVLARTEDGRVLAWGWGDDGNCGDLSKMEPPTTGSFVSGGWNEIVEIPGDICLLGAGANTSFVATWVDEGGAPEPKAHIEPAFEDQPPRSIDLSGQDDLRIERKPL